MATPLRYWLTENALEILLYNDIGVGSATPAAIAKLLGANPNASVTVRINSLGGDAYDGIAIGNLLAQHKGETTAQIDGIAASAGSLIAMGCKRIVMAKNATMMIHGVQLQPRGGVEEIERKLEPMRALNATLAETYAKRSRRDVAEVLAMMTATTHLTAEKAVELGFADAIVEPLSIAAKADSMLTLESPPPADPKPGDEPAKPADPNAPTDPAAPAKPGEGADFTVLAASLAKSTGYAPSAILACLLEAQDAIVEMLTRKLGDNPTVRATMDARRVSALEVRMSAEKVTALESQVASLKAKDEARTLADVTARVDGLIAGGYCRPDLKADAIAYFQHDAEKAAKMFSVKLVPVGDDAEQGALKAPALKAGEKFSEAHLVSDVEKMTLVHLRGGGMATDKAVEKIIALRAQGAA